MKCEIDLVIEVGLCLVPAVAKVMVIVMKVVVKKGTVKTKTVVKI